MAESSLWLSTRYKGDKIVRIISLMLGVGWKIMMANVAVVTRGRRTAVMTIIVMAITAMGVTARATVRLAMMLQEVSMVGDVIGGVKITIATWWSIELVTSGCQGLHKIVKSWQLYVML